MWSLPARSRMTWSSRGSSEKCGILLAHSTKVKSCLSAAWQILVTGSLVWRGRHPKINKSVSVLERSFTNTCTCRLAGGEQVQLQLFLGAQQTNSLLVLLLAFIHFFKLIMYFNALKSIFYRYKQRYINTVCYLLTELVCKG